MRAASAVAVLAAIACSGPPEARAPEGGPPAADRVHVFGVEDMGEWPGTDGGARAATEFALRGMDKCDAVEPRALAEVRGSFSAPGAREAVYTVEVGGCGTGIGQFGSRRLVLARDGVPVASFESGGEVLKSFDLDGDGRDEVLLSWGGCEGGTCRRSANIASLSESGIRTVAELGTVYRSDCGRSGGGVRVKDVSARTRGGRLLLDQARMDRPCPA